MAILKLNSFFLVFFVSSILISTCFLGDKCLPKDHVALFVFGDSLFDAGNNNYINTSSHFEANYSPYGETFFKYPSGRFSDGRVIPDIIAEYAKLPLIQPYLFPGYQQYINGVNFASAGAGALVETHQGLVVDLKTQLSYFKKVSKALRQQLGEREATTLLAKAVYLFSIGGNDYSVYLPQNHNVFTAYPLEKYVEMVVGNITDVIKGIHKIGGRKFGILNQPPAGCFPVVKALLNATNRSSCIDGASEPSRIHNHVLSAQLHKLNKHLNGFKYSLVDFYDLFYQVINNLSKYGFKEGGVACCGSGPYRGYFSCGGKRRQVKDYELCENPTQYVFFDAIHPTEKAHQIISQFMWSGNQSITGPYNLRTLFETTI